jgi:hypothetical protein
MYAVLARISMRARMSECAIHDTGSVGDSIVGVLSTFSDRIGDVVRRRERRYPPHVVFEVLGTASCVSIAASGSTELSAGGGSRESGA